MECNAFVRNMYKGIKFKICMNGMSSDFWCIIGIRQGEHLSPFVFTIYINDLHVEDCLLDKNIVMLQSISAL